MLDMGKCSCAGRCVCIGETLRRYVIHLGKNLWGMCASHWAHSSMPQGGGAPYDGHFEIIWQLRFYIYHVIHNI